MNNAINGDRAFKFGLYSILVVGVMLLSTNLKLKNFIVVSDLVNVLLLCLFVYFGFKSISAFVKSIKLKESRTFKLLIGFLCGLFVITFVLILFYQFVIDLGKFI